MHYSFLKSWAVFIAGRVICRTDWFHCTVLFWIWEWNSAISLLFVLVVLGISAMLASCLNTLIFFPFFFPAIN